MCKECIVVAIELSNVKLKDSKLKF